MHKEYQPKRMDKANKKRCAWAGSDAIYRAYHDHEWGVPVYQDRKLFELLILEGAQAGLSFITILKKRASYRRAFDRFDPVKVSAYGALKVRALMGNSEIVRNRLKIKSSIENAKSFLNIQKEFGSFNKYVWSFVGHKPIMNKWRSLKEIPAQTALSATLSKDLRERGFNFVGPTICYAFMQAAGMVNDHTVDCFRYREVKYR